MSTSRTLVALVAVCAVAGCTSHARSGSQPATTATTSTATPSSAVPSSLAQSSLAQSRSAQGSLPTAVASPTVTATPVGDGSANAKDACTAYTKAIAQLHQNPPQVDQAVIQLATMAASAAAAETANHGRWQRLATDARALAASLNSGPFVKQPGADDPGVLAVGRDCA